MKKRTYWMIYIHAQISLSRRCERTRTRWRRGRQQKQQCQQQPRCYFYLQSQPKVSGHPQKKALPRFPSFNVATMMSTFLSIFFWTCKTTLGRGYGGKGSYCPMLLSEIVWKSYVKYVVSFYVMWIKTLLQSHGRAPPVQRWRCTILNKIITAATAMKLHGNRCILNHVDMNL